MIVKCINEREYGSIKNGTHYEVIAEFDKTYRIRDDNGVYADYYKSRFEVVDEVAPELELSEDFMDEIIGLELIKEDLEKEEVKGMRTLKERILAKVDYKAIAERIWDNIVDDVVDKVANNFDEDNIAEDLIYNYRSELIEQASEVIIEEVNEEISLSDIEDEIRDIARDLVNE